MSPIERWSCRCGNFRFTINTAIMENNVKKHVRICQECGLVQQRAVVWLDVDMKDIKAFEMHLTYKASYSGEG